MNIGSLTGVIELENDFSADLQNAATATDKQLKAMAQSFGDLGRKLSLGLTLPLTAAAGASLKFSSDFESSMTRLVSIAGVGSDELADVRKHILDLAPAVGIGPQALADAMTKVSSTVSDTKTALEILDIAAQGTKAGFGETVDVAGALTSVINSYGAENLTAARAADILAQAVKEGGAEAKELAPTLANVVPFAAQLGVSFEEVAANIATMTKLGVPTAEAVTSLTSVFSALTKETDQGSAALADVGLSYAGIRQEIQEKGLASALTGLSKQFKGNETALVDVFGRIEAVKNIMGTAGVQAETYADVLGKIKGSSDSATGAMQSMADVMSGKQAQSWKELRAQVETIAIKFGDTLAPAISSVLSAAGPLLDFVEDAVEGFSKLPHPIQLSVIGLGALAAAIGPLLLAASSILSTVTSLNAVMGTAGLAGVVGVGGPVVIAFAAGAIVLKKYLDLLDDLEAAQKKAMGVKPSDDLSKKARELAASLTPKIDVGQWSAIIGPIKGIGDAAAKAAPSVVVLTKEQKEAAKAMADAQRDIHLAMVPLTKDQEKQIDGWEKYKVSSDLVAKAIGVSSYAVDVYKDKTKDATDAQKKFEESTHRYYQTTLAGIPTLQTYKSELNGILMFGEDYSKEITAAQIATDSFGHTIKVNVLPSLQGMGGALAQAELRSAATITKLERLHKVLSPIEEVLGGIQSEWAQMAVVAARAIETVSTKLAAGDWVGAIVAAGAALGQFVTRLFRSEESAKVSPLRDVFFDAAGGLDVLNPKIQQLTGSLELVQAVFDARTVEQYNKAIDALNATLEYSDSAMQTLDATTRKYGFTIEELGPAMQRQELDKAAQDLFKDYEVLTAAGIELTTVHVRMADAVNSYVHDALKMGVEIPGAMKPMLDAMVSQGLLTDAAGNKITDLEDSGVSFALTMSEGFKALITEVSKLTDAISRGLGLAIANLPDADIAIRTHYEFPKDVPRGYDYDLPEPAYMAGGGRVLPFPGQPRGADTVPTWTSPGERVLTPAQNREYERGGGQEINITTISVLDGREVARGSTRYFTEEVARQTGRPA